MPETTRVPAAQDGLKTILAARPNLATIQLDVGQPDAGNAERESIWVYEGADSALKYGSLGNVVRDEAFDLFVAITVAKTTEDFIEIRDRAFALLAELEAAVKADDTLNGSVSWALLTGFRFANVGSRDPRICQIEARVSCSAKLQA